MATPKIVVGAWPWVTVCPSTRTAPDAEGIGVTRGDSIGTTTCVCAVGEGTGVAMGLEAVSATGVSAASDTGAGAFGGGATGVEGEDDGAGTDTG